MKQFSILGSILVGFSLLSCDPSAPGDATSEDATVILAPRLVTQPGVVLPRVDSVRVVVWNLNSQRADYERSVPWEAHGDTITGIPVNAKVQVRLSGVVNQQDSTRVIWWSGLADAIFSGTQSLQVQSLPVPVFVGDTAKPRVKLVAGDSVQATDSTLLLIWEITEGDSFQAMIDGKSVTYQRDSVVWASPWASGTRRTVVGWFRDRTGNLAVDTVVAIRRNRVSAPLFSTGSGNFIDTTRVSISDTTAGATIECSLDSGRTWEPYKTSFLFGQDTKLLARATKNGWTMSAVSEANFSIRAAAPVMATKDSVSNDLLTIRLTTRTPGAMIQYSLDTAKSWVPYEDSVVLGKSVSLQTRAVRTGLTTSTVTSRRFAISVSAPTFVAKDSVSNDFLAVKLFSLTPGASFEYSLDTAKTWLPYADSIVLGKTVALQARTLKAGMYSSSARTKGYRISVSPPTFSVPSGTSWNDRLMVKLSSATPGAKFEISSDSVTWKPNADSMVFGGQTTVWARAYKTGVSTSSPVKAFYLIRAAAPTFIAKDSVSNDLLAVRLSSLTPSASFEYSLDTAKTWLPYVDSIVLGKTITLLARAIKVGLDTSAPSSTRFSIEVSPPTFSVPSGTSWNDLLAVKMSSATLGAKCEISLDSGRTWALNGDSVVLGRTIAVQARAQKDDMSTSSVVTAQYVIQAETPSISHESGEYDSVIHVVIQAGTLGSWIRYTCDGSMPTSNSLLVAGKVAINSSCSLRAMVIKPGLSSGVAASREYTFRARPVQCKISGGLFPPFKVGLYSPTPQSKIHYTRDGRVPTESDSVYLDSLLFESPGDSILVRAIAIPLSNGIKSSAVADFLMWTGVSWKPGIEYGTVVDARDLKIYRSISIGNQVWMAENLSFESESSFEFSGDRKLAVTYGRYYTWASAMGLPDSCNRKYCPVDRQSKIQGICPQGWHLPDTAEAKALVRFVEANASVGLKNGSKALKSIALWTTGAGEDVFGFRALPAGYRDYIEQSFLSQGKKARFWTNHGINASMAWHFNMVEAYNDVEITTTMDKPMALSVRCLKD